MKHITAQEAASRLIQGAANASAKTKAGIESVTESPGIAAADSIDKMLRNLLAAFNSGKVERALRDINLSDWKAKALAGVSRIPGGLEANRAKIESFYSELLAYQEAYTAEIDAMPKTTLADSRARMIKNFDKMVEFGERRNSS